jgi:hypothetical protein
MEAEAEAEAEDEVEDEVADEALGELFATKVHLMKLLKPVPSLTTANPSCWCDGLWPTRCPISMLVSIWKIRRRLARSMRF